MTRGCLLETTAKNFYYVKLLCFEPGVTIFGTNCE